MAEATAETGAAGRRERPSPAENPGRAGVAEREPAEGRMRRVPQQVRSRERVQRLLEAADDVLGGEGYAALTMRRLADQADVPVGTIYQFFPDKAAVIDALARRYIAEFEAMIGALVEQAESQRWDDVVETVLGSAIAMYRSHPGYLAIWTGRHLSVELQRADDANNAAIAAGLRRILVAQHDLADDERLERVCRVAVHTTDALLQLAFRLDPRGDDSILAEAYRLQRLYLEDLVRS
ncbi:MAG: TetR/AcrR family transcriptional regulator [Acidimicrobiales bacterium]